MNYLASAAQLRAAVLRWALFTVPAMLGLGFLSGRGAGSGPDNPWFAALAKPGLYPPPITFPLVWTVLYLLMGLSLALVLAARGAPGRVVAVLAFVAQLVLNLAWSPVFFAMHRITLGLVVIALLALALAVTLVLFWRVRPVAALMLVPYLAWVCFAALLNYQFLALNPAADGVAGPVAVVQLGH